MIDPVIIAAFRVRHEAETAADALRDAGIEPEIRRYSDEVERLCLGALPNGYDVRVARADSERGIALLQALWPDPPAAQRRCPACGSTDIRRLRRLAIFGLMLPVLLGIYLVVGQRDLVLLALAIVAALLVIAKPSRCNACGEPLS